MEISFAGSELELTPAAGFSLPMASGTLRNDKGITIRNIDHQGQNNTITSTHPSRVPRITGFRRKRFDDGADAPLDDRFTPQIGRASCRERVYVLV